MGQHFGTAQSIPLPTQMCQGLTWGSLPHILRPLGAAFKLRAFIWSFELLWILRVLVALDNLPLDLHCNCGLIWGSGLAVVGWCHQTCFAPRVWVLRGRAACGELSTLPAFAVTFGFWLSVVVHPFSCCSIICSGVLNPEWSTMRLTFSPHRAFPIRFSLGFSPAGPHGYTGRSQPSVITTEDWEWVQRLGLKCSGWRH